MISTCITKISFIEIFSKYYLCLVFFFFFAHSAFFSRWFSFSSLLTRVCFFLLCRAFVIRHVQQVTDYYVRKCTCPSIFGMCVLCMCKRVNLLPVVFLFLLSFDSGIFECLSIRGIFSTDQLVFNFWIHNVLLCEWNLLENKVPLNLYSTREKKMKRFFFFFFLFALKMAQRQKSKIFSTDLVVWKSKPVVAAIDCWKWMRIWHFSNDLSPWQTSKWKLWLKPPKKKREHFDAWHIHTYSFALNVCWLEFFSI